MTRRWKTILGFSLIGNLAIFYVAYKALDYRANTNYFLDKYTYVTEEFSSRDTFAQANVPLRSDSTVDGRIVFFGTQLMAHWDLNRYFSDYEAIGRGVVGQKAAGFLLRFKPDVIDLAPQAVLIELSSYNFRPGTTIKELEDYASLMAQLSRANGIEPILSTIVPPVEKVGIEDRDDYSVNDSLLVYNQWLVAHCRSNGYAFVDFYRLLADSSGFLVAQLAANNFDPEPNEMGYRRLSDAVIQTLNDLNIFGKSSQ